MTLWGGRFAKKLDQDVLKFTSSIGLDQRLYEYDIKGSIAHTRTLRRAKIISAKESEKIIRGLQKILVDLKKGSLQIDQTAEDIHSFIEEELTKSIGSVAGKLHTARSRNDQICLDLRLYLRDEIQNIRKLIRKFQKTILEIAEKNIAGIMPGFTHLQPAEPVLFAHWLLAYYFMLKRDKERLEEVSKRVGRMPLGSGSLAGVDFPYDRAYTARLLGFSDVIENSIDAVSDRDFVIEFLSAASILMMHLSRLSEEIVLWSSAEFRFIELGEEFSTGSSMLPQKKNPDVAELVRAKTGEVYGNLVGLLTVMKGLPLSYNRDTQEDKHYLFEAMDTLKTSLIIYPRLLRTMKINKNIMEKTAENGFGESTMLANYLVKRGVAFREAHFIIGRLVRYSERRGKSLAELSLSELRQFSDKFAKDVIGKINVKSCLREKKTAGSTSPREVMRTINKEEKQLEGRHA